MSPRSYGTSNSVTFTVRSVPQNPVPVLTSISPTYVDVGSPDTQISVYGSGFVAGHGGEGAYCAEPCSADPDCPQGYQCVGGTTVEGQVAAGKVCLPVGVGGKPGTCACSPLAEIKGRSTLCTVGDPNGKLTGQCPGKRTCKSAEGLSACNAAPPVAEVCDGKDNDCNGATDDGLCSDGNSCTLDTCTPTNGSCSHAPLESSCDDGDDCTTGDACVSGACSGKPKTCAGTECGAGVCQKGVCTTEPKKAGTPCDDGNACSTGDTCKQVGSELKCIASAMVACNDGKVCTNDACDIAVGCTYTSASVACDDGLNCTTGDTCIGGNCQGKPVASACDDGNPCTSDACNPQTGCSHTASSGASCDDGNGCTTGDVCTNGTCTAGPVTCTCAQDSDCPDDGDPCNGTAYCDKSKPGNFACKLKGVVACLPSTSACLTNVCSAKTGACGPVPTTDGSNCSDGSVCTLNDACAGGTCKGGSALDCNDGNPCTVDACDKTAGCTHTANTGSCDDGNACTTGDVCQSGACVGGSTKACPDPGSECATVACDPANGACTTSKLTGVACSDGKACTLGDSCQDGVCKPGAVSCSDGKPCTDDTCSAAGVCTYTAKVCDDGLKCTTDSCNEATGACTAVVNTCDDGNPCTIDACNPATGKCQASTGVVCPTGKVCNPKTGGCGLPWASDVSGGEGTSCVRRAVDTVTPVACWGANGSRQLGDGSMTRRTAPVTVMPLPRDAV